MPTLVVRAGRLSAEQLAFWRDAYLNGLREHFLLNRIQSFGGGGGGGLQLSIRHDEEASAGGGGKRGGGGGRSGSAGAGAGGGGKRAGGRAGGKAFAGNGNAAAAAAAAAPAAAAPSAGAAASSGSGSGDGSEAAEAAARRVLVPLGGGKDSSCVLEMVRRAGAVPVPFFLSDPPGEFEGCWRYAALCAHAGVPASDVCVAEFAWEEASWVRWHARRERHDNGEPWDDSARLWACLVGFAAAVGARLKGCEFVAVGNERSANQGNGACWEGVEINRESPPLARTRRARPPVAGASRRCAPVHGQTSTTSRSPSSAACTPTCGRRGCTTFPLSCTCGTCRSSPPISPHLPTTPHISPHLPTSPHTSRHLLAPFCSPTAPARSGSSLPHSPLISPDPRWSSTSAGSPPATSP